MAQHFVTVDSVTKKFPDPVLEQLAVDLPPGGGASSWGELDEIPARVAAIGAAADDAAARAAIGAGTSNLTLGATAGTAKAGDWTPAVGDIAELDDAIEIAAAAAAAALPVQYARAVHDPVTGWPVRPDAVHVDWLGGEPGQNPPALDADVWIRDIAEAVEPDPPLEFLLTWDGTGLSNGATLTTSSATGDDTAPAAVTGADVKITTGLTGLGTGITFTQQAAETSYAYWTLPAPRSVARVRHELITPAAWPASSQVIYRIGSATSPRGSLNISGSGNPGRLRLNDGSNTQIAETPGNTLTVNTAYWVEDALDLTNGIRRIYLHRKSDGALLWDSGALTSFNHGGSTFDRVYLGCYNASPTVTWRAGHLAVHEDKDQTIGGHE